MSSIRYVHAVVIQTSVGNGVRRYAHTYTPVVSYFRSGLALGVFSLPPTSFLSSSDSSYLLDSQYMHIFALTLIYQQQVA